MALTSRSSLAEIRHELDRTDAPRIKIWCVDGDLVEDEPHDEWSPDWMALHDVPSGQLDLHEGDLVGPEKDGPESYSGWFLVQLDRERLQQLVIEYPNAVTVRSSRKEFVAALDATSSPRLRIWCDMHDFRNPRPGSWRSSGLYVEGLDVILPIAEDDPQAHGWAEIPRTVLFEALGVTSKGDPAITRLLKEDD